MVINRFDSALRSIILSLCLLLSTEARLSARETSIFDDPDAFPDSQPTAPAQSLSPASVSPTPTPPPSDPGPVAPAPDPSDAATASGPPPTSPAGAPTARLKPPDPASKTKVLKLVRQVFEQEYKQTTPAARRQLSSELLTEAGKVQKNSAAKFVLLEEARDAALAGGDVKVCRTAIDGLNRSFSLDTSGITADALIRLSASAAVEPAVNLWALDDIESRIQSDDYSGAERIVHLISRKIAGSADSCALARLKASQVVLAEYARAHRSREKLSTDPSDAAANLVCGKFLCFYQHDWARGLPLLVKGNDPKLAGLAQKDLSNPAEATAQYQLAGEWWDLEKAGPRSQNQVASHERAAWWYEKSLPNLTGLPNTMAERRLFDVLTGDATKNMLSQMKPDGGGDPKAAPEGIRLSRGPIKSPREYSVPLKIDIIAMTDSTNLRMKFRSGETILNWEGNQTELRLSDPFGGIAGIGGRGKIPINTFVRVTWLIQEHTEKLYVNGEERGVIGGDYGAASGYVWVYPAASTITIRYISITQLPPDDSAP